MRVTLLLKVHGGAAGVGGQGHQHQGWGLGGGFSATDNGLCRVASPKLVMEESPESCASPPLKLIGVLRFI